MQELLAIILLWPLWVSTAEGTGCISGRYWSDGEQVIDYSVTLEPGGIEVQSDSNGVYFFPDLTPGWYSVSLCSDSVLVVAGDTTFADKAHISWDWWREITEYYQYKLLFKIVSDEPVSLDGFVIYGSYRGLNRLPFSIEDDSLIAVRTPAGSFGFVWSLPGYPEQSVVLRDCPSVRNEVNELHLPSDFAPPWSEELEYFSHIDMSGYPLAAADTLMRQWSDDDRAISHTIFNPKNSEFSSHHCIDAGLAFQGDSGWRVWGVFKDEIITLESSGRLRHCEVPGPVCSASVSPSARWAVVIVREPWESTYVFRWYRINLEQGRVLDFDPFPEMDIVEEKLFLSGFETIMPQAWVYLADDGSVHLKVAGKLHTTYNTSGELVQSFDYQNTDMREIRSSADNRWWLVRTVIDWEYPVYTVGDAAESSVLEVEGFNPGPYTQTGISSAGRYVVFYGRSEGLWVYDLHKEALRELNVRGRVHYRSLVFSEDERFLACKVYTPCPSYTREAYSGTSETLLFDLSDESSPCVLRFPDYSHVYMSTPLAVSTRGWVLMRLWERGGGYNQYRFRAALIDSHGQLAWLGHYIDTNRHNFGYYSRWGQFSSSGDMCSFSDGDQIHLLRIEEFE